MRLDFVTNDNGRPPLVKIDDIQLRLTYLTYVWKTESNDLATSNICVVDGYLGDGHTLRRFISNMVSGVTVEVPIEEPIRKYEVYIQNADLAAPGQWKSKIFTELKNGDIFRVFDQGRRHYELNGVDTWVVVDAEHLNVGKLEVLPFSFESR